MEVLAAILQIPEGFSTGIYKNKKYSITKEIFNNGKSFKIFGKALEDTDFISLNYYITSKNEYLKPCEMPQEKVIHFLKNVQLINRTLKMNTHKKAYIAGGCFWGMEDLFRVRPGIIDTEVGYIGGQNENPTYRNHPGHAEGIEIIYNSEETNFKEILDYFFRIHNPTTIDRQGNDIGSSYRSAIFYQNEEELKAAKEIIALVNNSGKWEGNVATTLEAYSKFWDAEPEHQDYLVKKPDGYTCHFERFSEPFI
ncbi:peptide-methionine (S)-S-oxide reductase MsrA [Polaribacter sp.]|uniref:peptide-methionine (S)-S-oxide reductase MsrA n=1 Tax=Polaribacter sp. TaxID=1920175 RepID=UPI003EF8CA57